MVVRACEKNEEGQVIPSYVNVSFWKNEAKTNKS